MDGPSPRLSPLLGSRCELGWLARAWPVGGSSCASGDVLVNSIRRKQSYIIVAGVVDRQPFRAAAAAALRRGCHEKVKATKG